MIDRKPHPLDILAIVQCAVCGRRIERRTLVGDGDLEEFYRHLLDEGWAGFADPKVTQSIFWYCPKHGDAASLARENLTS